MKFALFLAALAAFSVARADDLPPAQPLLDDVLRAMPDRPLQINGSLQSKSADGKSEQKLQLEMLLDWQADPPQARYTIRDSFGKTLSFMGIMWPRDAEPEHRHMKGDPLAGAPTPPLGEQIEGTDITWLDLSLSFLRWKGGRTTGSEKIRGRECYVVDIDAPKGTPGYSGVRLWIEPKIHILLRAESYNEKIEPIRRLDVNSFKKINDRWFVGEIELRSLPSNHRTILRVQSVYDRERKVYLTRDQAAGDATQPAANESVDKIEIPPLGPVPAP